MQLTAELPVHLFNADLVACYVLREHSFGDMRHYHPVFFELTLVRRGGTEGWVGDKLDRLTPGALVLPSPDLPMPTATRPSGAAVDMPEHPLPGARCSTAPHSGPLCFHTFQYVEAASDMPERPLPGARCSAAPHSGPLCFHTFQYVEAASDMPERPLPGARCSTAPYSGPLCFHTFQYVEAASPIT